MPPADRGLHLRIGDTVKFGRVRFKVIMLKNKPEGEQVYKESRFNQKAADRKDHGQHLSSYRNTLSDEEGEEFEEEERIVPDDEVNMQPEEARFDLAQSMP